MMTSPNASPDKPVTIAVTSGKGGVGKTNVTVNLAIALARLRHRVVVIDGDFGLGSVDVLLGLTPAHHIGHVLAGERSLADIVVEGPGGVRIVPASSGIRQLTALGRMQREQILGQIRHVAQGSDFLLIDTAPGVSDTVLETVRGADLALVVTSGEPTAIVDAYAMIKLLTVRHAEMDLGLLVNGADNEREAHLIYGQLDAATRRFLRRTIHSFGHVVHDEALRDAVLCQRAVVDLHPDAVSSHGFRALAMELGRLSPRRCDLRPVGPGRAHALAPMLTGAP
ncbi:MAG: MinD/ParA family protein [Acidobacteriota bacterium]